MRNRPEIDGLRAVAVLPVLLFHADLGCPGGFVGVDVFFVISGFLITRIVVEELEHATFSLWNFWERRIRRIIPALSIVVCASLAAGWFLLFPANFKNLGDSVMAQTALIANIHFWRLSGYFQETTEVKPLLHTWSLAVEEQFYLAFPLLLILLVRYRKITQIAVIIIIGCSSLMLSVYMSFTHPSANFFLLPTRAWELLCGALLAHLPSNDRPVRWKSEILTVGGFSMILCAICWFNRNTRFPGAAAIMPCLGTFLIIRETGRGRTLLGQLLASRPLVGIGLVSYSLYLWHWPVLTFSRYYVLGTFHYWERVVALLVALAFAILSWKFIERPMRRMKSGGRRWHVFAFAGLTALALFAAGLSVSLSQGFPSRVSAEVQHYANAATNRAEPHEISLEDAMVGRFAELGPRDKERRIELLLWGDSHAMAVAPAFDLLCKKYSVRGVQATHSSTAPLIGFVSDSRYALHEGSIPFNNAVIKFIRRAHIKNVVLVAYWSDYILSSGADRMVGLFDDCLQNTIRAVNSAGAAVWIIRDVPQYTFNIPRALARTVQFGGNPTALGMPMEQHLKQAELEARAFKRVTGRHMEVLDPAPLFVGDANTLKVTQNGEALYYDGQHLTIDGAMLLVPLFEAIFSAERVQEDLQEKKGLR